MIVEFPVASSNNSVYNVARSYQTVGEPRGAELSGYVGEPVFVIARLRPNFLRNSIHYCTSDTRFPIPEQSRHWYPL